MNPLRNSDPFYGHLVCLQNFFIAGESSCRVRCRRLCQFRTTCTVASRSRTCSSSSNQTPTLFRHAFACAPPTSMSKKLSLSPFALPSPALAHFNRVAGSQSGQDKLFMVYQCASRSDDGSRNER